MKDTEEILMGLDAMQSGTGRIYAENDNLDNIHDWVADYWYMVEENINSSISTYLKNNSFDAKDEVDRESLGEFISDRVQEGILNVIDSYKE